MRPGARFWTKDEDRQILAAWTSGGDMSRIARKIDRSYQSCISRITEMRKADPSIPYRNPAGRVRA